MSKPCVVFNFMVSSFSVVMSKTGRCCYILKFMALVIPCLEMVLHFGTAEIDCKKVDMFLHLG